MQNIFRSHVPLVECKWFTWSMSCQWITRIQSLTRQKSLRFVESSRFHVIKIHFNLAKQCCILSFQYCHLRPQGWHSGMGRVINWTVKLSYHLHIVLQPWYFKLHHAFIGHFSLIHSLHFSRNISSTKESFTKINLQIDVTWLDLTWLIY